jgi:hypothetical protein
MRHAIGLILLAVLGASASGQEKSADSRMDALEKRVQQLEQKDNREGWIVPRIPDMAFPAGFFWLGVGVFCGLWARSTGRDPWLWLVAGLTFNMLTLFVIFHLWSEDEEAKKKKKAAEFASPPDSAREGGPSRQNIKPA